MVYVKGWLKDSPDSRDFTLKHPEVQKLAKKLGIAKAVELPASIDLRANDTPILDQGQLGSCTAHSAAGLYQYMEKKAYGDFIPVSRLFVYKATRILEHMTGDSGAELRSTMGCMALMGCPPEEYWKYTDKTPDFDSMPPAYMWALGQNYQAQQYVKLDGASPTDTLANAKASLASGLPFIFGFNVFQSYQQAGGNGMIPYPASGEAPVGGHAIMAVGYDDAIKITNNASGQTTTGALLFRNSWGTGWGMKGYGWLPYQYILSSMAQDLWNFTSPEYVATGNFGFEN